MGSVILSLLLVGCEVERPDDTRSIHPFGGEELVLFSYYETGSNTLLVEASHTIPVYELGAPREVDDLVVRASLGGEDYVLSYSGQGTYVAVVDPVPAGALLSISVSHSDYGEVASEQVVVPQKTFLEDTEVRRVNDRILIRGSYDFLPGLSYSSKLLRYGEGGEIGNGGTHLLPIIGAVDDLSAEIGRTREHSFRSEFVVFDRESLVPIDTVRVDSVAMVLYAWSYEVAPFLKSVAETGGQFGDGLESIDGVTYTNVRNGYGLVTAFATDTVIYVLE